MIKRVIIEGLPSYQYKELDLHFNDDINIITGVNGRGKTTILKLIWYIYSGNLIKAISEINFDSVHMYTDSHLISVVRCSEEKLSDPQSEYHTGYDIHIEQLKNNEVLLSSLGFDSEVLDIKYCSHLVSEINKASLFFPTFRRIEGFSKKTKKIRERINFRDNEEEILADALRRIASLISSGDHKYITAVSTKDINELIMSKYAEISEKINEEYKILTDSIESEIVVKSEKNNDLAMSQLEEIKKLIRSNKEYRNQEFTPITIINNLVLEIFNIKGIKIGNTIGLGLQKERIDSEYLSAGEKQMLSFIAYNAFYNNVPFIIDEPEISLHADWQRKFLNMMSSQNTNNQIIIATHSPFIYTKYSDKEIMKDFDIV